MVSHKRDGLIAGIFFLSTLSGCMAEEQDVLQIMFGGTWTVYIFSLLIVYFFSRQKIKDLDLGANLNNIWVSFCHAETGET